MDQVIALIVDESKWLTASMTCALLAVTTLVYRFRPSNLESGNLESGRLTLAAMNLFFGVTIGAMAFGHLLAVTTKLALGTLEGSVLLFYAIGIALAVPSWWIIVHTRQILIPEADHGRRTLVLSGWLVLTLLALGPHNLPLAAPGFLNAAYHLQTRRPLGWAIVGLAVLVNGGLFVGSVIFFLSGQSFEQFQGS